MNVNNNKEIVVRFPPSPTGEIHIGNVRTLLFNYLFARKNNGKIIFRFEDTDKERSRKEFEEPMLRALTTLGLNWDEGPFRQSERGEFYTKYLKELLDKKLAYEDVENKSGTGKIIRLKNIEREIVWQDAVKGEIKINTHTFKERDEDGNFVGTNSADIIIARSIDDPIYHFTVVVDDWLMGVTHVIRGDDHITSTPRQIMILEALGAQIPTYAHLTTIIGEDRKKLSKRNGVTSLQSFFDLGYLPEAMVNYLALLGWNPGDEREFFTLDELVKEFSLEKCQVSAAQFDFKKLDHINKFYLDKQNEEEFQKNIIKSLSVKNKDFFKGHSNSSKILNLVVRERLAKYSEINQIIDAGELDFYFETPVVKKASLICPEKLRKGKEVTDEDVKKHLKIVLEKLEEISENDWQNEIIKNSLWDYATEEGRGIVLWAMRYALSGKEKSPDPFTLSFILGKSETLIRIENAIPL